MCSWEEVETLAIWLECHSWEVKRLRSDNQTLRSAADQILTSFFDRTSVPNAKKWEMIKEALCEMNKNSAVKELGIDQLISSEINQKENKSLKNARLCKVCKDKKANRLFLPCAHLSSCSDCSSTLTKCSQCNANIREIVSVYFG